MKEIKHKNPLPCGCGIKGTPTLDDFGNSMHYANLFIDFCPMHKAAPDLLETLSAVKFSIKLDHLDERNKAWNGLLENIEKVIAKAEVREP